MGLCKCPKKKVTNLFCFEHRVNVCENCLVANHQKCIIKSYLQWLQDSDYNPLCVLCDKNLSDENCGECVRLTCYDVFHWYCLNKYAQQLPSNTAPAGYTCPCCKAGIFPAQNVVSPVAEQLKEHLSKVNWARSGLGLPLIEETEAPVQPKFEETKITHDTPVRKEYAQTTSSSPKTTPSHTRPSAHVAPTVNSTHSVISVDTGTSVRGSDKAYGVVDSRKVFDTTKDDYLNLPSDHDDNKYRRRSAMEWLKNWLKSRDVKGKKKDPAAVRKKFFLVLLLGLIGFITVIIIFHRLGREGSDDDPLLDMMANPNIRVNENRVLGE